MLDDLRRSAVEAEEDEVIAVDETDNYAAPRGRFLGMTAVERMLLSIMLFMLVTVMGVLLLLVTGRLG
jgi:hypothetical protein